MFTQVRSSDRRVAPAEDHSHQAVMKAVYLVLEPQYQNSLTQAAKTLNAQNGDLGIELSGYLIEELRDPQNFAEFEADIEAADVFIASLIFIEDLAQKVVDAVAPHRDRLKAVVVFPSMPEVMRLNKLGSFSMAQLGQSNSAIASFMKKRKESSGAGFQDAMLKLLNTLPTVLKYLPVEKAQDARSFILSFQYWLGGTPDNLRNLLLMLADKYVFPESAGETRPYVEVVAPEVFPDLGIWHPMAPAMFEDLREYLNWTASRADISEAARQGPLIGLVLQRSHIVTGDDAHYVAVIQELEYRGA
ncbi:MAG: DUF3479 domain-containing protein, partial [Prochlorococcus sp.]